VVHRHDLRRQAAPNRRRTRRLAFAIACLRGPRKSSIRRPGLTITRCAGLATSEVRSVRAKQASADHRSALSEVVRGDSLVGVIREPARFEHERRCLHASAGAGWVSPNGVWRSPAVWRPGQAQPVARGRAQPRGPSAWPIGPSAGLGGAWPAARRRTAQALAAAARGPRRAVEPRGRRGRLRARDRAQSQRRRTPRIPSGAWARCADGIFSRAVQIAPGMRRLVETADPGGDIDKGETSWPTHSTHIPRHSSQARRCW
jgi:hypothetical protein